MNRIVILIRVFLIIFLIFIKNICFAEPSLKIAILDNFIKLQTADYISIKYYKNYSKGLILAKEHAKHLGINIEYKMFLYGDKPLDIFKYIKAVNAFAPNVIIGPRGSNEFLMLKNMFKNILVLSPYATADDIKTLPSNFQSLTLPNKTTAIASAELISQLYPNKNIVAVIEQDCKDCVDFSTEFSAAYHKLNSATKITSIDFLSSEVNSFNIANAIKNYDQKNTIFLVPNNSNTTFIVIYRILSALKKPATFIGGSNWGTYVSQELGENLKIGQYYTGMQIAPWSMHNKDKSYQDFQHRYHKKYSTLSREPITYLSYQTVMSMVMAYEKSSALDRGNLTHAYLQSYLEALKRDPFWYKSTKYAVITYTPKDHGIYTGAFDVIKNKYIKSAGLMPCK